MADSPLRKIQINEDGHSFRPENSDLRLNSRVLEGMIAEKHENENSRKNRISNVCEQVLCGRFKY